MLICSRTPARPGVHRQRPTGRWRRCGLVLLWLLMAALPGHAKRAAENEGAAAPSHYFSPATGISLQQATTIARQATGGRVLSAAPEVRGSKTEYRVRVLVDGARVRTVVVDDQGRIKSER